MISAEIKINGMLIGYLRLGNIELLEGDECFYEGEYYRVRDGVQPITLTHKRSDGAEKLIEAALRKVK